MKSFFRSTFLILLVLLTAKLYAAAPTLQALEDSLKKTGPKVFKGPDQEKIAANAKFLAFMQQALEMEGAFAYPFDSLPFIARLNAPDNAFRIFNWNIPMNDGTHAYYGFILVDQDQLETKKKKKSRLKSSNRYVLYTLTDQSDFIRNPELATLNCDKWFGCLYYKVIHTSHKGKNYYTLLGWDGNTPMTWKKVIDVLTFGKDGQPIFGEEMMFQVNKLSKRRVIFEFKAELVMTLKYEEKGKRIVCDVLAPEVSGAEGMRQFYVNTGAYDAYVFKKGKWVYQPDQDIRNQKDKKDDKYIPPDGMNPPPK